MNLFSSVDCVQQGANVDEERAAERAMRQQEFDARMDEVNQARKLRTSLADAMRPASVNDNASTLDIGAKPVVYEDHGGQIVTIGRPVAWVCLTSILHSRRWQSMVRPTPDVRLSMQRRQTTTSRKQYRLSIETIVICAP